MVPVLLIGLLVVLGVALVFALVIGTFARRTLRFQRAIHETWPGFAARHGLTVEPKGSPDRLTAMHGPYRGTTLRIELIIVRRPSIDPGSGESVIHMIPATSISAAVDGDLPGRFELVMEPSLADGWAIGEAEDPRRLREAITPERAELLAELGTTREARLRSTGALLVLRWNRAEDDPYVLERAADLCVAFAARPRPDPQPSELT